MRNMSFSVTKEQIKNGTKTVTRRLGWGFLKHGDIVMACEKCMGLKKGEKIKKIRPIYIIKNNPEYLFRITESDIIREGFPNITAEEFIEKFCQMNKCAPHSLVYRIEFGYLNKKEA